MSLFEKLKMLQEHNAAQYFYAHIEPDHVDTPYKVAEAEAGRHYYQLWLREMYLQNDRTWFSTWYPAVHSLISHAYGSQSIELPYIAGSLNLPGVDKNTLNQSVRLNYPLTPLMPFNGGTVTMEAGLLAMQGDNYLNQAIKVVGDFASLLTLPQVSLALNIAQKVAQSVNELFDASDGKMHLGFRQTFVGKGRDGDKLGSGYLVVILTPQDQIQKAQLGIVEGRLHVGTSSVASRLYTDHTYMLFYIECLEERDDWDALSSIQVPFERAIEALGNGDEEGAKSFLSTAITAIRLSSDLTKADRIRVVGALKAAYKEAKDTGLGAVATDGTSLKDVINSFALPVGQALQERELTFSEVFADL
jgi:hypothetical protein